ncbi:MAG TPA: hypothetical protein VFR59_07100 [Steroidobacteraceae bacterium]|nr:hypothetical protein [Steroidobacteraceae bacterium]
MDKTTRLRALVLALAPLIAAADPTGFTTQFPIEDCYFSGARRGRTGRGSARRRFR